MNEWETVGRDPAPSVGVDPMPNGSLAYNDLIHGLPWHSERIIDILRLRLQEQLGDSAIVESCVLLSVTIDII